MRASWIAVAALTAGCAGGAAPAPPGPAAPAFTYVVPEPATLVYERTDSSLLTMEIAGAGAMNVNVALRTVAQLAFAAAAGDGVQVRIDVTELDATMASDMAGTRRISQTPGSALVSVAADGHVEVVEKPTLPTELAQLAGGESLYRNYFLQLPSRDLPMGQDWVDTLSVTEEASGMQTTSETIVRSVWARDTMVAGRTLRVVESTMDVTARAEGSAEGTRIEQSLAGNGTATTLWDPVRHVIVLRQERGEMSGSMALPDMGMSGMPVSMESRSRMELRTGG